METIFAVNPLAVKEEIKIVEKLIKMLSRDLDYRSLELKKLKDKESLLESEGQPLNNQNQ